MTTLEFNALVRQYQGLVYTVCHQLVPDEGDAQDLAQETFLAAWRAIDRCPPGYEKQWLARIASNKAKDYLRSAWVRRVNTPGDDILALEGAPPGSDPEQQVLDAMSEETLTEKILGMREPYRTPCRLMLLEGRKGGAKMELFREDGCMTDAGFRAMMDGQLDELGRLEAAEHLSYCDQCMDRYTALLTADALETPPKSMQGAVMGTIWARLMQNTYGRAAVAGVAAVLALTLWRSGALQQIIQYGAGRENVLETDQSQLWEPGRNDPAPENTPQYRPIEDDRPQAAPEQLGRPVETKQDRRYAGEGSSLLHKLLTDVTDKIAGNTPNTEK